MQKPKKIRAGEYEYLGARIHHMELVGRWVILDLPERFGHGRAIDHLTGGFKTMRAAMDALGGTMIERRNIMSGEYFMERADTPYYLSPSSETYWSS